MDDYGHYTETDSYGGIYYVFISDITEKHDAEQNRHEQKDRMISELENETIEKNKACNGHYINVVKAIKWWKRKAMPNDKHPKSYPLEHFIGNCCPDGIHSVAEGIAESFKKILCYPKKPFLPDRGVPEHDVFESLSEEDYQTFYNAVKQYHPLAKKAIESVDTAESVRLWRQFFCNCEEFPSYRGGFTPRTQKTESVPTGRFG